jgi:hypothetical protein
MVQKEERTNFFPFETSKNYKIKIFLSIGKKKIFFKYIKTTKKKFKKMFSIDFLISYFILVILK